MESVTTLLERTQSAALQIVVDGSHLIITGPAKAESIVGQIAERKREIIAYLQAKGCGALHIKPERWLKRDGKAYCPLCNRYMAHIVGHEQSAAATNV